MIHYEVNGGLLQAFDEHGRPRGQWGGGGALLVLLAALLNAAPELGEALACPVMRGPMAA